MGELLLASPSELALPVLRAPALVRCAAFWGRFAVTAKRSWRVAAARSMAFLRLRSSLEVQVS